METAYCVRSVITDGSGHSIVDTDCMPEAALVWTLSNLTAMYNGSVSTGGVPGFERYTFTQTLSDGRRVSDMIIASRIH